MGGGGSVGGGDIFRTLELEARVTGNFSGSQDARCGLAGQARMHSGTGHCIIDCLRTTTF